jgi:hypothetical protein
MRQVALRILLLLSLTLFAGETRAQTPDPNKAEELITRILAVDKAQRDQVKDITFDAEYIEREAADSGQGDEKVRMMKKISIKYFPDTAWYHEEFMQYYKQGKLQSQDDLKDEAADRREKKRRRGALDISYPMLKPFWPDHRALYTIEYKGTAPESINGHSCEHFAVTAKEPADSLFNGDYYFEGTGLHLARVDFSPSKLIHRTMFKMSEFKMSLSYTPTVEGLWFPSEFNIQFKAKAMWVIGVKVKGVEYYRNPVINSGVEDKLFDADKPTKSE